MRSTVMTWTPSCNSLRRTPFLNRTEDRRMGKEIPGQRSCATRLYYSAARASIVRGRSARNRNPVLWMTYSAEMRRVEANLSTDYWKIQLESNLTSFSKCDSIAVSGTAPPIERLAGLKGSAQASGPQGLLACFLRYLSDRR